MSKFKKVLISLLLVIIITSSLFISVSAVSSSTTIVGSFFNQVAASCLTSGYDVSSNWLPYTDDNIFSYVYRNGDIPSGTTLDIDYEFQVKPEFVEQFLYYDMEFTFQNINNAKFYSFSKWYFVFEDGSTSSPALFTKVSASNTVSLRFNGLATNYPIRLKSIVFDMRYTTTVVDSDMGLQFTSVSLKMYDENRKNTEDIMANQTENTDRIISNQTEIANDFKNGWSADDKTADDTVIKDSEQVEEEILNSEVKVLIGYGANGEPIYSTGTMSDLSNTMISDIKNFVVDFLAAPLGLMSANIFLTKLMTISEIEIILYFSLSIGLIAFLFGLSLFVFRSFNLGGKGK